MLEYLKDLKLDQNIDRIYLKQYRKNKTLKTKIRYSRNKKILEQIKYDVKQNIIDYKKYYKNEKLKEHQIFKKGILVLNKKWYSNNKLKKDFTYNLKDNSSIELNYFNNSQMMSIISQINNLNHGKVETWDSKGDLVSSFNYEFGKKISGIEYTYDQTIIWENGHILSQKSNSTEQLEGEQIETKYNDDNTYWHISTNYENGKIHLRKIETLYNENENFIKRIYTYYWHGIQIFDDSIIEAINLYMEFLQMKDTSEDIRCAAIDFDYDDMVYLDINLSKFITQTLQKIKIDTVEFDKKLKKVIDNLEQVCWTCQITHGGIYFEIFQDTVLTIIKNLKKYYLKGELWIEY